MITLVGTFDISNARGEMSVTSVGGDSYWEGWLDVPNDVEDDDALWVWVVSETTFDDGGKVLAPAGWELVNDDNHAGSHVRWRLYYRKANAEPGTYVWHFQALDKGERYTAICAAMRPQDKSQPFEENAMGPVYSGVVNNLPLVCEELWPPHSGCMYVAIAYWCQGNAIAHGWAPGVTNEIAVDAIDGGSAKRYLLFGTIENPPDAAVSASTVAGGFTTGPVNAGTNAYMFRVALSHGELSEKFGTLGRATSSATGKVQVKGAAARQLGAATLSARGDTPAKGAVARTLGELAIDIEADAPAKGTAALELDTATVAAAGELRIAGSVTHQLAPAATTATGKVKLAGTLSRQLAPTTTTAVGKVQVKGSASRQLAPATISAAGAVPARGATSRQLDALTVVSGGKAISGGQLSLALDDVSATATATARVDGTATATLGALELEAEGDTPTHGHAKATLAALQLAALTGVHVAGSLSATLEDVYTAPTFAGAWAISTHSVRVILSAEPQHTSQFLPGDALHPSTWHVERLTDGFAYTVIGVTMPDDVTVDLILLEALGNHLVTHAVEASGLLGAGGSQAGSLLEGTFVGVVQTIDPVDAVTVDVFRDRDLANPPFQVDRGIGYAGTLVIGSDGDYETEAGPPLLRKLLLRRLGTRRNAFRHLPGYGVGLVEKEPIPGAGNLLRLRTEIEDQAMQEPDAEAATASLTLDRSGVLVVQLSVKPRGGAATINLRLRSSGGRLVEL